MNNYIPIEIEQNIPTTIIEEASSTDIQVVDIDIEQPITQLTDLIRELLQRAQKLVVSDSSTHNINTQLYKHAREWRKLIDAKRKEMVEPFRAKTAEINDKAKSLTDELDKVIWITNTNTSAYQKQLEEIQRKEAEKIKAAALLFDVKEDIYIEPVPTVIRAQGAISTTRTVRKFRIVDLAKVPLKYIQIHERAVENDLKLGINSIEGLEIYEEKITTLRTR